MLPRYHRYSKLHPISQLSHLGYPILFRPISLLLATTFLLLRIIIKIRNWEWFG